MTPHECEEVVTLCLKNWERETNELWPDDEFSAWEKLNDSIEAKPDEGWQLILELIAKTNSERVLGMIAAGPLEDLLAKHPHEVIDRIEQRALSDTKFRFCLGGVWQHATPDDVWRRLYAFCENLIAMGLEEWRPPARG